MQACSDGNFNILLFTEIDVIHTLYLHPASATGVIVLTSCVCECVCVLPLSRPNGQRYGPEFWGVDQMEGYVGQV